MSSALVNVVLKRIFGRVRPDLENLQRHRRLRREPGSLSFPSGHSSSAAAFVTGVAMESPLAGAALAPVALGVGYSRVHVGVHYPGDVVAGLAVGGAVAAATPALVAGAAQASRPASGRRYEAPALPEGEGLVVAVNPRSGPDDYDPAEDIRRLLPRAEVLETDRGGRGRRAARRGGAVRPREGARRGRRRRQRRRGGGRGARARPAAGGHRRRARSTTSPGTSAWRRPQDTADAVVCGAGRAGRRRRRQRDAVPQHLEHRRATRRWSRRRDQLSGRMGKWLAMTVAAAQVLRHGSRRCELVVNGRPLTVWIIFVGNCLYTPRGLSPAWRPRLEDGLLDVQYLRADLRFGRTRAVLATLLGVSDRARLRASRPRGAGPVAAGPTTAVATTEFDARPSEVTAPPIVSPARWPRLASHGRR